jgi:kinesin family member 11
MEQFIATYVFTQVFGQYSTQEEVFNLSIVPIIEEVLQGFNCTVFAYGQTGTGKTHTMEGEMGATANAGIIPRSLHMLFEKLTRTASEFSVRLSFMELYNEVCPT